MKNIQEQFRKELELQSKDKSINQIPFSCSPPKSALDGGIKTIKVKDPITNKNKVELRDLRSFFLEDYIPTPEQPLTFICLNIHVFQNSQGGNNFQKCDTSRWEQIMRWVNSYFAFNAVPSDTAICGSHTIPQQGIHSRIIFTTNRMEYYTSDILNTETSDTAFVNAMNQRDPGMQNQLNIFLAGVPLTPHANILPSSNPNDNSFVTVTSTYNGSDYVGAQTLVHELGHVLGLHHTYNSPPSPVTDENDNFYLFDVFGCGSDKIIPHNGGWLSEPYAADRDGQTNNIMSGSYKIGWISTLQIAQMHYHLKNSHIKKYVNCCCKFSKCAFGAVTDRHKSSGAETVIEYTHTHANYSWAFDGKTFTAPCDGLYSFSLFFQKDSLVDGGTPDNVWIHLVSNDTELLGKAMSEKSDQKTSWSPGTQQFGRRDSVGFSNIFDLKKGTVLKTVINSDGVNLRNVCDINFSGYLIFNKNNY